MTRTPDAQLKEAGGPVASRMTACPRPHEYGRLADIGAATSWADPDQRKLLDGTAGCSPYLADLIIRESDWLKGALDAPETAFETLLADIQVQHLDALSVELRQAKRRVHLLTALCDVAGVWSLEEVTQSLTRFANTSVHLCLTRLVEAEIARGKLPMLTADDATAAGGMFAIGMGKMGAGELNYSSDIDLICLFDETRFDPDDYHDARASFIRVTRKMTALLSDMTSGGYVFRTDLRLRPDASVTPVCLSTEAAERYYESVGRTWERAAYIKADYAGGDAQACRRFLDTLAPFVWRKHLDFAAIQDAHDMRLRIRDHKGLGGPLTLPGHNMKLGRGGIREIEFFTQTRQLIAGGRDPSLRVRGTVDGLARLHDAGWVPQDTRDRLTDHYLFHRTIEHRMQMVNDAQTHDLPNDDAGFERLAAFTGREVAALKADIKDRLDEVHSLTEGFFAPQEPVVGDACDWGADITNRWLTYPALRSDRARDIFKRIKPVILDHLSEAARPEEALAQFDTFLAGLPAGVQVFSLFDANEKLTRLIADICATAPALAEYLSRNSGVLDAVIGGAFFAEWPGVAGLKSDLMRRLDTAPDYEAKLVAARLWQRDWHFRVGVHHLRGLIDAQTAGEQYAHLAEATLAGLWPCVIDDMARKHGTPPGNGAILLAMGSLGAGRLNAASDLDLIVIYDADGEAESDGLRPLAARPYYARLTQAMITALTAPMGEGRLYEVDMRLRPSGKQGPVATSIDAFETYQQTEAWTWEHLALTRARPIAGPGALQHRVAACRCQLLSEKGGARDVKADVTDMRTRLTGAKPPTGPLDAKAGPGRLMECELAAQTLCLLSGGSAHRVPDQISKGIDAGVVDADTGAALSTAYDRFWRLQAASRLLVGGTVDPDKLGEAGLAFIKRETGQQSVAAIAEWVADSADKAAAAFDRIVRHD